MILIDRMSLLSDAYDPSTDEIIELSFFKVKWKFDPYSNRKK